MELLAKNILKYRKARKLTLEQLGDKTGVGHNYLSKVERGLKTPSLELTVRIAEALDVSLDDLIGLERTA